jgi:hypothetical protein
MRKRRSLPPLPPLSRQALDEVERIAEDVESALLDCGDNLERARQILRTGVAESLDVRMGYYFSLPNYHSAWIVEIARTTVDSMIPLIPSLTLMPIEQFRDDLLLTAIHHLGAKASSWAKNKTATAAPPEPSLPPSEETIAVQLKRLRDECDWTIPALPEAVNLDVSTVARHLSGQCIPYARNISAYKRVFSKELKRQVLIDKMPLKMRRRSNEDAVKMPAKRHQTCH